MKKIKKDHTKNRNVSQLDEAQGASEERTESYETIRQRSTGAGNAVIDQEQPAQTAAPTGRDAVRNIPDLSIIIPAYNEVDRIADSIDRIADYLKHHDLGIVELLIICQEPDDGTEVAAKVKAKEYYFVRVVQGGPRRGKGHAVRIGMFEAKGRYRLFMDADLATPLHHLQDVKRLMDEDAKVGIAVRDLVRIHKGLMRKAITKLANIGAQVLLLPGIKDTQCGFKVFEGQAAEEIFSRQTLPGWSFDVEILVIARKLGYKIHTIEANDWREPKGEGQGLVGDSPLKAALKEAFTLFLIRGNAWRGIYKNPSYEYKPHQPGN